MIKVRQQLLELTRCALWGGEVDITRFEGDVDWAAIFTAAKEQTIIGTLVGVLEALPAEVAPPKSMLMKAHMMLVKNRQMYQCEAEVLKRIYQLLSEAGITRPILLKGLGIAQYYPDPTTRAVGDIDLYVTPKEWERAREVLQGIAEVDDSGSSEKHLHLHIGSIPIELHRVVFEDRRIYKNSDTCVSRSHAEMESGKVGCFDIDGTSITTPPVTFNAFFIFLHAWIHYTTGGIGLRHLCDLSLLLNREAANIDREELAESLDRYGLTHIWRIFISIAVDRLGLNPDFAPLYISDPQKADYLLERVWEGGNFGYHHDVQQRSPRFFVRRKRQICKIFDDYNILAPLCPEYAKGVRNYQIVNFFKSSIKYIANIYRRS